MRFLFRDCDLDMERYELHRAGQAVPLEPKAFKVLAYLVQHHGRAVGKRDLLAAFWPGAAADSYKEYALRNCLNKIRHALGDARRPAVVIETIRGYGYRFVAPVTILSPAPHDAGMLSQDASASRSASAHIGVRPLLPERRQLTVLRCGLCLTAGMQRLDPDDFQSLLQVFYTACEQVLAAWGGAIAQYDGTEILVYFGYPVAQEDAAPRAVRAGLALVAALPRLPSPLACAPDLRFALRLSIHTGPVVVDESAEPASGAPPVSGVMLSVAKRLQEWATPDTVLISAETYALVQAYFVCEIVTPPYADRAGAALTLYRVLRARRAQSRFDVAVARGLTPLVGRTAEIALLRERWVQVLEGLGQVVLLSGEAGIGKSRLVQVVRDDVIGPAATHIVWHGSPYDQHRPLAPLITYLHQVLACGPDETPEAHLHKLEHTLKAYGFSLPDMVPLFAVLLAIPLCAPYAPLALTPQQHKQRTLDAVLRWLAAEAARQPVLLVVEDLHWIDASTLEFLSLLVDQGPTVPVYTLLTCRPEFASPWTSRTHVTQLTLGRLPHQQVQRMVASVAGSKALPAEVVQQVISKTDGVPLFVEELTKMVLESAWLQEQEDRYTLTAPLPSLAIPATLHDSLMARLDRLAAAKEVAQLGATIGRQFSYVLLQAVAPWDDATLQQALARLVDAELLYQQGLAPQATYIFKHALIQDIAYQSLLTSTRQHYHQRIAQVLPEQWPETAETQPALLAYHYQCSGDRDQAVTYLHRAGQQALQQSAYGEAISHLTKGLELLATLPETPQHLQQELHIQLTLAPALIATKGYAAHEVAQAYQRARELLQHAGEPAQLFPVLRGLAAYYYVRAAYQSARELAEECLTLAQSLQQPALILEGHSALGSTLFFVGECAAARAHCEQGIALYLSQRPRSHAYPLGQDPGMGCLSYAALALWLLGYPDQAVERSAAAIALGDALNHPFSQARTLIWAAILSQFRREREAVRTHAAATLALAAAQGFPLWDTFGSFLHSWALAVEGLATEGLTQMRRSLMTFQVTGAVGFQPYLLALLAEAHEKAHQVEEGLIVLAEALAIVGNTAERFYEPELHRLQGELLLKRSTAEQAEAARCFQRALTLACHQQAKSLELRAAMSLARLWQPQGKRAEAYALLAPIYDWFTEGFDSADLQEARALLAELAE